MPRFVELRRLITFLTDESNLDLKSFSFARLRRPLASQRSLDASTSTVPIRHGRTRNRHPGFGRRQLDSEPAVRNGEYDARRLPGRGFLDGKIRNSKRQSRTKIYLYHSPFHDSLRAAGTCEGPVGYRTGPDRDILDLGISRRFCEALPMSLVGEVEIACDAMGHGL